MLTGRYLVLIEDDAIMGNSILQRLELEGAEVTWVKQAVRGVAAVRTPHKPVDGVVCDIRLPDGTGEDIFNTVSRSVSPPPFLFITGQGEIDQAVRLLRAGAADYMTKPFEMQAFLNRLALIMRPEQVEGLPPQTGISPLARQVDAQVADLAVAGKPVLIRGLRGLGKSRIARRIHDLSDRRAAPFVTLNANDKNTDDKALADALDSAADGTVFINGIGRLNATGQTRLVNVLSEGKMRLLASCDTQIEENVRAGSFRADLFYAFVSNEIVVPPLSQRVEDAVWLAEQLFQVLNSTRSKALKGISELAIATIRDHDWPGNGRELRSRLRRAFEIAEGDWIFPADMFPELNEDIPEVHTLSEARALAERRQIIKALGKTGGQLAEAARLLKISRTTLWEKMQRHNL